MCKKQAAVSHSSAESDVISLDAGLRRDGIRALELWDWVVEVLHSSPKGDWARGDLKRKECETHHKGRTKTKSLTSEESCLREIDYVTPNVTLSRQNALLNIFVDDLAAIEMIIKGRCPTMRHVSPTQTLALDWLFDPMIQVKYVDTRNLLADMLTKGTF